MHKAGMLWTKCVQGLPVPQETFLFGECMESC